LQTDGFEVGDSAAGPQVEEVVVGVLRDGLTLVPVVVHVETLASRISLTPFMTFIRIFIQILKKLLFQKVEYKELFRDTPSQGSQTQSVLRAA